MSNKNKIKSAVAALLTLSASALSVAADDMIAPPGTEKCYGIAKAGMNDCATGGATCSGSAKIDNQKDAFLFTPTGLCAKIKGGSIKKL